MSTHTPGPWIADDCNILSGRHVVAIAYDPDDHAHLTPTSKANARLIAAAPDLLTALKSARSRLHDLLDYGPEGEAVAKFCDAAIIKAEG